MPVTLICEICGSPFDVPERRAATARYCGSTCHMIGLAEHNRGSAPTKRPPEPELRRLYVDHHLSTREIASHYGVSHMSVKRWLRRYGIERRPPISPNSLVLRGGSPPTRDELTAMVLVEHLPHIEIAKRFGVHEVAVKQWIRKHGIEQPARWVQRRRGFVPDLPDEVTLRRLYLVEHRSLRDIAQQFGVSEVPIRTLAEDLGVPLRRDGFDGGRRFICADGHEVRSSYELRVDDWLSAHGVPHVYEPRLTFDRRYCADFLANGWYIEIWGVAGSPDYQARKQRKIALYHRHDAPLLELGRWSFSTMSGPNWHVKLERVLTPPSHQSPPASHQVAPALQQLHLALQTDEEP